MADRDTSQELIRKSILAIYNSPTDRATLINLGRQLNEWDEINFPGKEFQSQKLFEDLQSLSAFLENRGLTAQADEIFRFILYTFPEKYFPSLPWLKETQEIDFRLFEEAEFVLKNKNYADFIQESFRLFNEQFRKVNRKLIAFAHEVENFQFKENGTGEAGELFRSFADVADKLYPTVLKDMPWTVINQMAMKLNNGLSCFNAAYIMLRALHTIKTARPSPGLIDLMGRNEKFFQRNHLWKCIDDDMAGQNYSSLVQSIDRYLPMADSGYERSNLLLMREKALKNVNDIPKGYLTYTILGMLVVVVVAIVLYEPSPRSNLNLDRAREELIAAGKKSAHEASQPEEASSDIDPDFDKSLEVASRTGLRERKPPNRPHKRKLNIYEIRHAVFQKMRIDYLRELTLTKEEQGRLNEMIRDYSIRCEFYEYASEDREKVHWDAKIHAPRIVQDAQDILAGWRLEFAPVDVDKLVSQELLSLGNPEHVGLILERLKLYGYYREKESANVWNEAAKRALLDFKVSNLGIVDSAWDRPTQKALFGK